MGKAQFIVVEVSQTAGEADEFSELNRKTALSYTPKLMMSSERLYKVGRKLDVAKQKDPAALLEGIVR